MGRRRPTKVTLFVDLRGYIAAMERASKLQFPKPDDRGDNG